MVSQQKKSTKLQMALWAAQILLALSFIGSGLFKLVTPVSTLADMWPWAGEYPNLLRFTGTLDLCGGIGVILPAFIRKPGLIVWAASGLVTLMVCAIVFHLSRGEAANTPFNFVMLGLALFVFWGRRMSRW
ncbi:DoxX family protein [Spirosoma aureum]|uniref:DoxX family protein n=1 Tax=Spirosoma aureum TaxID=2692134 RepID=A0A6G9AMB0_9BACT|nr:DoxX family protein [Spirosoma aureum]QIP13587.1 DoxX family protein [Spirosoma aureum]